MNQYPKVSIISVNYNQPEVTAEMIESLQKTTYPNYEIIVVDNGSPTANCKSIEHQFPHVKFIYLDKNLGFAGGNNVGFKYAQGKFILMLNNDTEVTENFLEPLVARLQNNEKIAVVSPKILYYHHPSIIQYAGTSKINPITSRGRHFGNKEKDTGQFSKAMPTYYPHGAAMMFKKSLLNEIGLMYEGYFLYYEEYDFSERIKQKGYEIWFEPQSEVYHKESISTGKNSPLKTYYLTRNRILFLRRNVFGATYRAAITYFLLLAFPKNLLKHLLKGEKEHVISMLKGIAWHLKAKTTEIHQNLKLDSYATI